MLFFKILNKEEKIGLQQAHQQRKFLGNAGKRALIQIILVAQRVPNSTVKDNNKLFALMLTTNRYWQKSPPVFDILRM
jgi:hypothetical protein